MCNWIVARLEGDLNWRGFSNQSNLLQVNIVSFYLYPARFKTCYLPAQNVRSNLNEIKLWKIKLEIEAFKVHWVIKVVHPLIGNSINSFAIQVSRRALLGQQVLKYRSGWKQNQDLRVMCQQRSPIDRPLRFEQDKGWLTQSSGRNTVYSQEGLSSLGHDSSDGPCLVQLCWSWFESQL